MKSKSVIAVLVGALFLISMFAPLIVSSQIEMAPRIHIKEGTSTNWSGYAALATTTGKKAQTVTDVKGSWTVPAVSGVGTTYSAFWIGIDGYSSNTVEQIGTDSNVINGAAQYSAWYEIYPKYPVTIPITISAGDKITAEVSYASRAFTLTITDTTTAKTFTTTQKCPQAALSSAEWIAEAPWSSGVLPLANFGTVTFTGCSATIGGNTASISGFPNDAINMVTSSGATKASTGSLTNGGADFSVTWLHS
jgi:hypothetical protein